MDNEEGTLNTSIASVVCSLGVYLTRGQIRPWWLRGAHDRTRRLQGKE
jgi:hypothetical protein